MEDAQFTTHPAIVRHPANPILSAKDAPYRATLVFNAGIAKFQGKYVMVFRNDYGDAEQKKLTGRNLGIAFSDDGVKWDVKDKPINEDDHHPLKNCYDPRLTVLDGRVYLCFATGGNGTRGGVAVTDDFESWEVLNVSIPDNRNMVIFPERFDGKIARLERPFAGYLRPGDPFDMWLSMSPDGRYWGDSKLVLDAHDVPWCNNKVGPGAPPVKTPKGWLAVTHVVDIADGRAWGWSGDWNKRYTMGVVLLDLDDPAKVVAMSRKPVLVPEADYETTGGYRDHVIFPGGMVLEDDGSVKIYYGAADTVECLATTTVDDLLGMCEPVARSYSYSQSEGRKKAPIASRIMSTITREIRRKKLGPAHPPEELFP